MTDHKKNIPQPNKQPPEAEDLLRYAGHELPHAAQQAFEEAAENDPFLQDAIEGLHDFNQPKEIPILLNDLHQNLKQQLHKKQQRRNKRKLKEQPWLIVAIIFILGVLVLGYFLVRF